ncbi:hypothetical protein D3C87_2037950 [compost metagenome]
MDFLASFHAFPAYIHAVEEVFLGGRADFVQKEINPLAPLRGAAKTLAAVLAAA